MELKKKILPISAGLLFVFLFSITVGVLLYYSPMYVDNLIVKHIERFQTIFNNIDKDCTIIGFENDKNQIDFLTVTKFVGQQVGSMTLGNADKWQGPYVQYNPRVQETLYQIVRTHKGYFIVPGDGVKLSNGKTIGKDIKFNLNSDIEKLLNDKKALLSTNGPLGTKIKSKFVNADFKVNYLASEDVELID